MGQLLFAKYKMFTGRCLLNIVCWVFYQMNLIFNKWHLFDFIAIIRLWMHMIFEISDLISEQKRCTNRENIDWICKILDIDNSRLSSENSAVRGHNVDLDRNAEISYQIGGKETQVKKMIKWNSSMSINRFNSEQHCLEEYDGFAFEGHFQNSEISADSRVWLSPKDIIAWVHHDKSWRVCKPPRLTGGIICFEASRLRV